MQQSIFLLRRPSLKLDTLPCNLRKAQRLICQASDSLPSTLQPVLPPPPSIHLVYVYSVLIDTTSLERKAWSHRRCVDKEAGRQHSPGASCPCPGPSPPSQPCASKRQRGKTPPRRSWRRGCGSRSPSSRKYGRRPGGRGGVYS